MKIVRVQTDEGISYGTAEPGGVRIHKGSPLVAWEETEVLIPFDKVELLSPVLPSKVVCIGRNYADHAAEMGSEVPDEPKIFIKPSTSVVGPGANIVYPEDSTNVHHEAELAIVMGGIARHVKAEDADSMILGYTAANDVTARDLQRKDGQWTRAKSFDTFCPIGPAINTEFNAAEGMRIAASVNGELRQEGSTSDMIFGPHELVAFVSRVMTLLPGDVILTGTPAGVGPMQPGDRVDIEIEGIGVLSNKVVGK
jgi:2-keto-4-pentenoate hydratase/2-oxohepta-3-ene-1,7-dioic acid hydratase in catechol pathway